MAKNPDEKIQIVAFSTNDSSQTTNDIINIFLGHQNHQILKKSKFAIAFSTTLKNQTKETRVMICSVLNLKKEYSVNFYLLFIDLEKKDSIEKIEQIINYAEEYCSPTKKIFVLGMISGNEDEQVQIDKSEITKILDDASTKQNIKKLICQKLRKQQILLWIFLIIAPNNSIFEEESYDKGENQGNHVLYFECFSF